MRRKSVSFLGPMIAALLLLPTNLLGQQCEVSAVLDDERAYFGPNLTSNSCTTNGVVCEQVYFTSLQGQGTAVCEGGRWTQRAESEDVAVSCPSYVFSEDEIFGQGGYQSNSCDVSTAAVCGKTYFARLDQGGSGYRTAACREGRWQELDFETSTDEFQLRRIDSGTSLAAYLKQGLKQTFSYWSPYLYGPGVVVGGPSGGPAAGPGGGSPPRSQTNVQESGVDEADRIKANDDYLFILENRQSLRAASASTSEVGVRVVAVDPAGGAADDLARIDLPFESARPDGIYLREDADQLVAVGSDRYLGWWYWYSPLAWLDTLTEVVSVDVSDPVQPAEPTTLELEGSLISSRRIGNTLYLATRFHPTIEGLGFYDPNDLSGAARAIGLIDSASLEELLPKVRTSGSSEWRPLVKSWDCFVPAGDVPHRTADIVTLVAVNLDSMDVQSSACFAGTSETIYVSLESVYLASTRYEYDLVFDGDFRTEFRQSRVETDLHKFSLGSGRISYQGSGVVDGHLGWSVDRKPFRLSESGSDLRVVTYTAELTPDSSPVALTVLRDRGRSQLETLSRLPNDSHPDPIGKPGERLYATRFVGNRAYLVTFRATDPLYVVDLSDPEDPFVAGELEITGYSDYLHPIGENYVLGVGKDAVAQEGAPNFGAWFQGVKVALYDVRDPSNPFEADSWIIGKRGSEAELLSTHKAFTVLETPGANPRIAFGVRVHDRTPAFTQPSPSTRYGWTYSGLVLFEVDVSNGKIFPQGEMRVETFDTSPGALGYQPWLRGQDRSLLFGDSVFYVHGDDVYTALWTNPWQFEGPE